MAIFDRIMHRGMEGQLRTKVNPATCSHANLVPQWETEADMDDEAKASGYRCANCWAEIDPGQVYLMRAKAARR